MLCYRDISFCGSQVKEHTCGREFTKEDAKLAEKWWGGKDYPVAYAKFCTEATGSPKSGTMSGEHQTLRKLAQSKPSRDKEEK